MIRKKHPGAVALGRIRSPKKAAAARLNGLKGGGTPLRWTVLSVPGTDAHARPLWFAYDRQTRRSERAATYHAARALVRAYNQTEPPAA
jgi:hypothetical protein